MTSSLTFNIVALGDAFTKIIELGDSVERLGAKLDELDRKKADPKISVDTTEANAKIDELNRKINSAGGGGGGIGGGAAIGGAIALGLGPLAGAGLLVIPAAIAAIGIAAVHSNADVQTAFTGLTSAAKVSLTQGFAPFVPTLVAIASQGKAAITGLTPTFQQAAVGAAPLLQVVSAGLINATKDGVTATVPLLKGLGPVAQALADDFGKAERGVAGFLSNLDTSGAANGLTILGTDLEQILPAVGSLVSEVIPLANAILSDLGPALRNTASDLVVLTPLLNAAGAVISFLGPDIATLGPPVLAVLGVVKLMTGSWLDFSGAAGKIKPLVSDLGGTLESLGQKIGYTTTAANLQAKADKEAAVVAAQQTQTAKEAALATAADAAATDSSATATVALSTAQKEAQAAAKATAVAERELAASTEAASFSFVPLGIALGALTLLALPFIGNLTSSSDATSKLVGELGNLQQAATSTSSLAHLFQTDPNAQSQLNLLQRYGITLKDLADAQNGNVQAQQKIAEAAKRAQDAINAKSDADQKQLDLLTAQNTTTDANGTSTTIYTAALNAAQAAVNADKGAREQANQTYKDAKTQLDSTTAAQQAMAATTAQSGEVQQQATSMANVLGVSIGTLTQEYQDLAMGIKYAMTPTQQMSDTILGQQLAVGAANSTITNYFKQADQAASQASQSLVDANHSYAQSVTAVGDAQHAAAQSYQAVITARQGGVVTAQRSVTDALANEVTAENNVTKAQVAQTQAQVNLNVATQQAVEQLKALHLQMADQVTSEESAKLALFDQTATSKALGVTPDNAAALAATPIDQITPANETQIKAAIDLLKAEQALNDTLNTGANLRDQVSAADKAGVAGSQGVLSAQSALASAQDQVVSSEQALIKSHQAVDDAQANVIKSEQGVRDSLYNEQKAHLAVADSMYNEQKAAQAVGAAQVALQAARDNDSHSMDIHTAAGQRNLGMLKQVADQLYANEPRLQADNDLIQNTSTVFGISTDAAKVFLDKMGILTAKQYNIDINAVASADLTVLNASYSKILAAGNRGTRAGSAFAAGGEIVGPGTGTSDSIPAITNTGALLRVSNGEYIVNALSARKNMPLLEMINSGKGYASGGSVDPAYQALSLAAFGGLYQGSVDVLTAMGIAAPPSLPPYVAPAITAGGGGNATPAQGGSAAQAQAYAQSIMGRYGWGSEQWIPWLKLGNEESGWNDNAVNASSGAYGIGQALGHGHPYNLGDYAAQVTWMADYIKGRYGNPAAAWAFETSHVPNWYRDGGPVIDALRAPKVRDNGGPIDPGWNMIFNGTGRAENSRSGAQEDALLAELRAMRRDLKNLQSVSVAAPQGSSASEVADMVMRRLAHRGRG